MDELPGSAKFIPISDAAKFLDVTPMTLRRWEKAGKLLPQRTLGGARRYDLELLKKFKANGNLLDNPNKKDLKIGQAAEVLGVTEKTLRLWEKDGKIKPHRSESNQRLFSFSQLLALTNKHSTVLNELKLISSDVLKEAKLIALEANEKVSRSKFGHRSIVLYKKFLKPQLLKHHNHLNERFNWYRKWHTFRFHRHIHWLALSTYILGVVTGLLLALSGGLRFPIFASGELSDTWDFSVQGNYSLSDGNLIEINGVVRLKTQEYSSDANTSLLFHLNETSGTAVDDSSSNNNDGTAFASVTWTGGIIGNGASLNGISGNIKVNDSASLSLSQSNTLEAWTKFSSTFNATSHSQRQGVVEKGNYRLYYDQETGKLTYELANSSAPTWSQQAGNDINGSWDLNGKLAVNTSKYIGSNLYVGLGNAVGDAEVWKWDGSTWTQIGGDGKNSSWADQTFENVTKLEVNGNTLYVGLGSTAGDAEVWSCDTSSNCSSWTKIGGDAINSSWVVNTFEEVNSMTFMGSTLYVGLGVSANDSEVWSWNGSSWTKIGGDSLNSGWTTNFEGVYSMTNDGTNVYAGLGLTAGDAEVWTWNGSSWTRIGGDAVNSSWANSTYEHVLSMQYFGSTLYAGLGSSAGDAEVWSWNGSSWTKIGGDTVNSSWDSSSFEGVYGISDDGTNLYIGLGATAGDNEVWSWNGSSWTKIGGDGVNSGFTNTHTIVQTLTYGNSTLFAGLQATGNNSEVWSWDGSAWTLIGGGYINNSWGFFNLQNVESMTVSGSYLYAGTGNTVAGNAQVWRFDGSVWTIVGGQGLNSSWAAKTYENVLSMVSFGGNLYAGLGTTANDAEVWSYNGSSWTQIGGDSLNSGWTTNFEEVSSLAAYGGVLYAGLGNSANDAEVWSWNGSAWTKIGGDSLNSGWTTNYERVSSMAVFNGLLHVGLGASANDSEVWSWNGSSWTKVGGDGLNSSWNTVYEQVEYLLPYNGELYAGLGNSTADAEVWKYDGSSWSQIGGDGLNSSWLDGQYEQTKTMTVYNGKLYAGLGNTAGDGEVWEYDGGTWSKVAGSLVNSSWAANIIETVQSFSVYKGKLYVGLGNTANADASVWSYGNNGYLQSTTVGQDTNWHHIAATYDGTTMKIFIDGAQDANTTISLTIPDNNLSLLLGSTYGTSESGLSQGFFAGSLDEIRVSNIARTSFQTTPYSAAAQTVRPTAAVRESGVYVWDSFSVNDTPNGGTITYRLSNDNGTTWKYYNSGWVASASTNQANSEAIINTNIGTFPVTNGGILWQAILDGDGTQQVTIDDVVIVASHDITAPATNADNIVMKKTAGGVNVASNGWTNNPAPHFSWDVGSDAESGLRGYCLYLGTSAGGDPATSKGLLGTSPVSTTGTNCGFIIGTNEIDFATLSYRGGTWLTSSTSPYYINIKAVDIAGNVFATSEQFQFRYDDTAPSNPAFVSPPGGFVATYTVTTTWPTAGGSAPADSHSGLAGLQYKISTTGKWYGDTHNGTEDSTDLLTNDGSYTTQTDPDFGGSLATDDLVEGVNNIYFRTWDTAGNVSSAFVSGEIKINTSAPSAPQSLIATPTTNTANSFAFDWDPPVTFQGSVNNITYCYTVNALPSANNCTFTAAGITQLSAAPYANQPGSNTFYVVARDEALNINYATYTSVTFTANTGSPGIPLNPDIADISVKATSNWRLAITWEQPTNVGAGVANYKIDRSTDNVNFAQVAATSGTSYVDTGLSQVRYYYKIKACDSANSCGSYSTVVDEIPTGKFTEAASLTAQPEVTSIGTQTVTINWVTDRSSDSRIVFGLASGNYFGSEISNSTQVTDHTLTINNLSAGTTYFARVKWTDEDGNVGTSQEFTFTTNPPPTIAEVTTRSINLTQGTVQFTSKDATKVNILFGKSTEFGGLKTVLTSTQESTYTAELTGLDDGTKYFFKINSFDNGGNEYPGNVFSFNTLARPRISDLKFDTVPGEPTSTMLITWLTNVPTSSTVNYSPEAGVETQNFNAELVTEHRVIIRELADDTQYTISVSGRDSLGNLATSDSNTFRTQLDTRAPKITEVTVETAIQGSGSDAKAQLIISWKTDEPATSQIEYGEGIGSNYSSKSVEDSNLVTDHIVILSELSPSKTYHLRAVSRDRSTNAAFSEDNTAITGRAAENVLEIIINSLRRSFGFLGGFFD